MKKINEVIPTNHPTNNVMSIQLALGTGRIYTQPIICLHSLLVAVLAFILYCQWHISITDLISRLLQYYFSSTQPTTHYPSFHPSIFSSTMQQMISHVHILYLYRAFHQPGIVIAVADVYQLIVLVVVGRDQIIQIPSNICQTENNTM